MCRQVHPPSCPAEELRARRSVRPSIDPHPYPCPHLLVAGPVSRIPASYDPQAEYEAVRGRPMARAGAAALRDPLAGRPNAAARRAALVRQQLGVSRHAAWVKLHADDLGDVCAAFVVYLACV